MVCFRRAVALLTLVASFFANAAVSPQNSDSERNGDGDHPAAREQWFRNGRTIRGEAAAARLYEGYRQKMRMRAQRRLRQGGAQSNPSGASDESLGTSSTSAFGSAVAASSSTSVIQWTPLGPAPINDSAEGYGNVSGRVTAIAVDQSDTTGNTVFIGGAYGGVWKTINGADPDPNAVKWTALTDDQPTLAIGSIALKPDNTDCKSAAPTNCVILVGTGEPDNAGDSYYGLGIMRFDPTASSCPDGTSPLNQWCLIRSADSGLRPFRGLGFSKIAFSSDNTQQVVAAAAAAQRGVVEGGEQPDTARGVYYSADAGLTWSRGTFTDPNGQTPDVGSITSVIYNPARRLFYAAYRFHGFYSSKDGKSWSRIPTQPGPLASALCPAGVPNPSTATCPLYRGEMALQPSTGDLFVWYVDKDDNDEGIYRSSDGGSSWATLHAAGNQGDGIYNCGDGSGGPTIGCSTKQGSYNLFIAAVPNGSSTDVYAGAVNIFKCSPSTANSNCTAPNSWLNLTHVYGCNLIASVHPDEHAVGFSVANPQVIYFGNDGGVYRTLQGLQLATSSCSGHNPFDNVNNSSLGSLTQFVSFSQDPNSSTILQAGAQDNGTSATSSAPAGWQVVNGGDGGYSEIDQSNGVNWFSEFPNFASDVPYVAIERCTSGTGCNPASFHTFLSRTQIPDAASFYTPYLLDPQMQSRMLIGTCRVWRGRSDVATFSGSAISPDFYTGVAAQCAPTDDKIAAIATGGAPRTNGSQVIYAGTAEGRVFVTTDAASGASSWTAAPIYSDLSNYPISDIAIDPNDKTGRTAYWTVMGFTGGTGHVWKTTDAGATHVDLTNNLPDVPADAVLVDPTDSTGKTIYVGNDVGVFVSTDGGQSWQEHGAGLPNVAVTKMRTFVSGTQKLLRVSTYGRGVWQAPLANNVPDFQVSLAALEIVTYPNQSAQVSGTITPINGYGQTITILCGAGVPATCTPNPATITPSAGPQSFSINVMSSVSGDFNVSIQAKGADGLTRTAAVTVHVADFSMSIDNAATVGHGTYVSLPLSIFALHGFSTNVSLSCSGLPADATCSFANNSVGVTRGAAASDTLQIFGGVNLAPKTYDVTITAQTADGALAHTATLAVTIVANTTFALVTGNTNLGAFKAGQPIPPASINLESADGYSGTVSLTCSGGCSLSKDSVVLTATSPPVPVTVNISPTEPGPGLTATVNGNDGATHKTLTFVYSIQDFTISAPASAAIVEGTSSNLQFSVLPVAGYSGALSATCDVSQIAGATCTTSPQPVVLNGVGTQAVTVTVAVPVGLVAKDYPVTLTETDASGLAHSATFNLAVQDFSLPSGVTVTAHQGSAGSAPLPIASLNNFSGPMTFSCASGLPAGAVCVFTPNIATVTAAGGSVTVTISTAAPSAAQPTDLIASNRANERVLALYAIWSSLPVFGIVAIAIPRPGRLRTYLTLLIVIGCVMLMVSCSGSGAKTNQLLNPVHSPGTPTGSYNVTVTASSSGTQRTTTVVLTVQ